MSYSDLSDLEEGEIFEYDSLSPDDSRSEDFDVKKGTFESFKNGKDAKKMRYEVKEDEGLYIFRHNKDGYVNDRLKEKLQLNEKVRDSKSSISIGDLESISSEEEYKSVEEEKFSDNKTEYYVCHNARRKKRERYSAEFYSTVEDIVCEIGERLCRKSHCNYKKRKSKHLKNNLDIYSDSSYDLWSRKIFSSHLKSKKYERKVSFCNSDSDKTVKKKKKKKRDVFYKETKKPAKTLKLMDFDEMRRNLLEKLKKQQAEEESKAISEGPPPELESSEIQEVDMLIDCTNYVDDPVPEDLVNEQRKSEEKEGEDESDLIKLRLIALASKKKPKNSEQVLPTQNDVSSRKNADEGSPQEVELDKNELLLRTEALKTAFLKKHQKRLKNKKLDSGNLMRNDGANRSSDQIGEKNLEKCDSDPCKENLNKESEVEAPGSSEISSVQVLYPAVKNNAPDEIDVVTNVNSKKTSFRGKSKRRKRKSVSLASSLKENENSETLEEDDRTLRTLLLSDLMRKKSLKDVERKSVLMDSVQTSANKNEPPKETEKPLPAPKITLSRKAVNVTKTGKLMAVPAFPKPEIQRIIIHLGSEDSSDEDSGFLQSQEVQTFTEDKKEESVAKFSDKNRQTEEVTQADYERSVELLLSEARKRIEEENRIATKTFSAPETVYKHLSPSQSKPANTRKPKKGSSTTPQPSKTLVTNKLSQSLKMAQLDLKPVNSPSSNISFVKNNLPQAKVVPNPTSNIKNSRLYNDLNGMKRKETNRRLVVNKINNFPATFPGKGSKKYVAPQVANGPKPPAPVPAATATVAATTERNALLLLSSQTLLSKLKLLKKIKTIEENYGKEILKLKNQLSLFEKKKCEQKFKGKKLGEETMKTYKAIQGFTEKLKEKDEDGGAKEEAEKAETEEGKKVSDEPETETGKAQTETDKEVVKEGKPCGSAAGGGSSSSSSSGSRLLKYDSPLQTFSETSDLSKRVDPNVMMCQFDLMGVCKDEECTYQHLRVS